MANTVYCYCDVLMRGGGNRSKEWMDADKYMGESERMKVGLPIKVDCWRKSGCRLVGIKPTTLVCGCDQISSIDPSVSLFP